jgi:hypothetical protein
LLGIGGARSDLGMGRLHARPQYGERKWGVGGVQQGHGGANRHRMRLVMGAARGGGDRVRKEHGREKEKRGELVFQGQWKKAN